MPSQTAPPSQPRSRSSVVTRDPYNGKTRKLCVSRSDLEGREGSDGEGLGSAADGGDMRTRLLLPGSLELRPDPRCGGNRMDIQELKGKRVMVRLTKPIEKDGKRLKTIVGTSGGSNDVW